MRPSEGQEVSYVGDGRDGLGPGRGRLLAVTGSGGHVKWATGPAADKITLTELDDLAVVTLTAARAPDPWDDSLETAEGFTVEAALGDDPWLFGDV